jgi:hypothetical protein
MATLLRVAFNVMVLLVLAGAMSYVIDKRVEHHDD